jgi:hypothetical protein
LDQSLKRTEDVENSEMVKGFLWGLRDSPRALIGCSGANQRWRGSASTWTLTLLLHNIIESLVFYDSRKRRTITYHYCQALKVKEERSFETKPTSWSRVIHTVTGAWVEKY